MRMSDDAFERLGELFGRRAEKGNVCDDDGAHFFFFALLNRLAWLPSSSAKSA